MSRRFFAIAALASLLAAPLARGEVPAAARAILEDWSIEGASTLTGQLKQQANGRDRLLTLDVEGRHYEIALTPADSVLAGLTVAERRALGSTRLYRGSLVGMPDAWARVTVADDSLYALLWDGQQFLAVEPQVRDEAGALSKATPTARGHQAYRPQGFSGLPFGADARRVRAAVAAAVNGPKGGTPPPNFAKADVNARLDVAWIADSLFSARHGTAVNDEMLARVNIVAGIFAEQLGLELGLLELRVLGAAEDDFSASDPSDLLDQVEQFKMSTTARREAGVLHLFTGRALEGSTVGIAAVGAACSARFGVSLTEARRPAAIDALIAAHEIGHNLNAPHDGEGACVGAPAGFLMASRLNQTEEFSACSIDVMVDFLQRASCLTDARSGDLAIAGEPPGSVLVGTVNTVEYLIDSPSDGDAFDVAVAVTFAEAGIAVRSVTLEGGVCTEGAARVDCALTSLRGGASSLLRVSFIGTAVGSWPLTVAVSSPGDDTPQDNVVEAIVSVRPAADLAVAFEELSLLVGPGGARRVPFAVVNDGPLIARNVIADFSAERSVLFNIEGVTGCRALAADRWRCEWAELAVGERLAGDLVAIAGEEIDVPVRREALALEVTSAYEDPVPEDNRASSELLVAPAVADLAARLLANGAALEIGQEQALELEITNNGPDQAQEVVLDVALSLASVTVLEASAGNGACTIDGADIRCELAALEVGERRTVRLLLRALAGERLRLSTSVSGADYDPATENDLETSELTLNDDSPPAEADDAVAAPAPSPSPAGQGAGSGGGGALDPAALLGLWLLILAVRQRGAWRS